MCSEIENLELIDVVESIFVYNGKRCHEIVFAYAGDLSRSELYFKDLIHIIEDTYEFDAEWILQSDILKGVIPLYPKLDYDFIFREVLK